jgi:hypothetical protein
MQHVLVVEADEETDVADIVAAVTAVPATVIESMQLIEPEDDRPDQMSIGYVYVFDTRVVY